MVNARGKQIALGKIQTEIEHTPLAHFDAKPIRHPQYLAMKGGLPRHFRWGSHVRYFHILPRDGQPHGYAFRDIPGGSQGIGDENLPIPGADPPAHRKLPITSDEAGGTTERGSGRSVAVALNCRTAFHHPSCISCGLSPGRLAHHQTKSAVRLFDAEKPSPCTLVVAGAPRTRRHVDGHHVSISFPVCGSDTHDQSEQKRQIEHSKHGDHTLVFHKTGEAEGAEPIL